MEILIHIDDEDRAKWQAITALLSKLVKNEVPEEELSQTRLEYQNAVSDFWHYIIQKYPYCKNKQIALNSLDDYIFSYSSHTDFFKYAK